VWKKEKSIEERESPKRGQTADRSSRLSKRKSRRDLKTKKSHEKEKKGEGETSGKIANTCAEDSDVRGHELERLKWGVEKEAGHKKSGQEETETSEKKRRSNLMKIKSRGEQAKCGREKAFRSETPVLRTGECLRERQKSQQKGFHPLVETAEGVYLLARASRRGQRGRVAAGGRLVCEK